MAKPAALVRFGSYGIPAQFGTPPLFIIPSEISVDTLSAVDFRAKCGLLSPCAVLRSDPAAFSAVFPTTQTEEIQCVN
jgi:hypothetical protein